MEPTAILLILTISVLLALAAIGYVALDHHHRAAYNRRQHDLDHPRKDTP